MRYILVNRSTEEPIPFDVIGQVLIYLSDLRTKKEDFRFSLWSCTANPYYRLEALAEVKKDGSMSVEYEPLS